MLRRIYTALAAGLIGAMLLGTGAQAQTLICSLGQKVCGNRCYSPLKGETCNVRK